MRALRGYGGGGVYASEFGDGVKREMFWADEANGAVRYENNTIAIECSPSEARALAKQLNDTVSRFFREERPVQAGLA
jgi:hypothetical protein